MAGISSGHAATVNSVSASSDDGNIAINTTDNDLTTRWSANGNDGSQWLQYDFGNEVTLSAVNVAFHKGDSRATYFRIESSTDGENWDTEVEEVNSEPSVGTPMRLTATDVGTHAN